MNQPPNLINKTLSLRGNVYPDFLLNIPLLKKKKIPHMIVSSSNKLFGCPSCCIYKDVIIQYIFFGTYLFWGFINVHAYPHCSTCEFFYFKVGGLRYFTVFLLLQRVLLIFSIMLNHMSYIIDNFWPYKNSSFIWFNLIHVFYI